MLSDYGEILHSQRMEIVEQWKKYLQQDLAELLPHLNIQLEYSAGFHVEQGLANDLIQYHQKMSIGVIPKMVHIGRFALKNASR